MSGSELLSRSRAQPCIHYYDTEQNKTIDCQTAHTTGYNTYPNIGY